MNWKELMDRTELSGYEIERLERIEENLPLIADLVGADLFIDCIQKKDGRMFVAAQAGPGYMQSAYQGSVIGCYAEREDEVVEQRICLHFLEQLAAHGKQFTRCAYCRIEACVERFEGGFVFPV